MREGDCEPLRSSRLFLFICAVRADCILAVGLGVVLFHGPEVIDVRGSPIPASIRTNSLPGPIRLRFSVRFSGRTSGLRSTAAGWVRRSRVLSDRRHAE